MSNPNVRDIIGYLKEQRFSRDPRNEADESNP